MIAKLELLLDLNNQEYDYNISSILHGIIMEQISTEYSEYLHKQKIVPYSISVTNYHDQLLWTINTLTEEAYDMIIKNFENISEINMKQKNKTIKVKKLSLKTMTYEKLVQDYYYNKSILKNEYTIYIQTPLAFKNGKDYTFMPDFRLLFRSIMKKFDLFSNDIKLYDLETINHLTEVIKIKKYKIRSNIFNLHNQKIPGLLGTITFTIDSNDAICRLVSLLLAYSEYSGVGIKTAIGMGSVSLCASQPHIIK